MIKQLRKAVERAEQQGEAEQRYIAQLIEMELDDEVWEEAPVLGVAFDEAHAEMAAGDLVDREAYRRQRLERERMQ